MAFFTTSITEVINNLPAVSAGEMPEGGWRQTHLGRLLGHALRRFDARVLALMASDVQVPLPLSNLAARGQVGPAPIHITRHLGLARPGLTEQRQNGGPAPQTRRHGPRGRTPPPGPHRARPPAQTRFQLVQLPAERPPAKADPPT